MDARLLEMINDPLAFGRLMWPDVRFWSKQREMIQSVRDHKETVVPAAKGLGKDFAASFICLAFFLRPMMFFPREYVAQVEAQRTPRFNPHTRRIVTTSVKDEHLDILWGEIGRFYSTCKWPLDYSQGGPCVRVEHEIRFKEEAGLAAADALNYLKGQVSKTGEGMSGHHAAYNLICIDEASAVDDLVMKGAQGWAKRHLVFSNTNPCRNFFFRACKEGERRDESGKLMRKIIHIRAQDSPNVALGLKQERLGIKPTGEMLYPGIISYEKYKDDRANLRPVDQEIDLDAKFPSDATVLLFPPEWLRRCELRAEELEQGRIKRQAKAMGVDPAEGGDRTAFCVVDEHGVLELISFKTPDTTSTFDNAMLMMRRWDVPGDKIVFDRACGKAHADRMRKLGFKAQTVDFGESILQDLKRGIVKLEDRREVRELKSIYKNRRVEMYHGLSELGRMGSGFGIPSRLRSVPRPEFSLFDQLEPVPYMFDEKGGDGKLMLPAKPDMIRELYDSRGSPDELDALVLAVHGLTHKSLTARAGVA